MIRTIIFDIGNVLALFSWQEHFASFGYDSDTLKKLGKATALSPDWNEYDLGNLTNEEILERFIKNDPSIEKELRESLKNVHGILTRLDYAIPWIEELKGKGYQVLYLSNFSEIAFRDCAHAIDFIPHMDGGIFSCKVHLTKPDPAIYKLLLEQYHLVPEECVFLDDMERNVEAAKALGIHGIHFVSHTQAKKELEALGVK
ncbi:MAG: HAD family hydrolase [Lachnospiraceae bacterium]